MDATLSESLEPVLRLAAFAGVFVALAGWEMLAPARRLGAPRWARWRANLGLALVNTLVVRLVVPGSAIAIAAVVEAGGWGLLNTVPLPGWAAILAGVVLLDLVVYFQHVLFHSVPALTRLHAVHHADPDFDLTTGVRFHPFEVLISLLIKLAAIAALGVPAPAVLAFEVVLNTTAMFNHANVSLPGWMEPWVRLFLVTPDMHRIHHSVLAAERNSNYGFCLPWWDRWLGTYTGAPRGELDLGLAEWRDRRSTATLGGALGMPWRS